MMILDFIALVFCYAAALSSLSVAATAAIQVQKLCSVDELQTDYVDCTNRNLTAVPTGLPSETRILDLSGNKIRQLDVLSFEKYPLLTEVYLAKNELSSINYASFTKLSHLKILDVSYNRLSHFNVDIPVFVEVLFLNDNPLLSGSIFQQRLIYIRYLSLASTNITQPSIFSSFLPTLQYLDLRNIPNLTLSVTDLKKLRHLSILYISPRIFSGRDRSQKCREFVKAAHQFKTEVKAFSCSPQENFAIKGRSFERVYQVDEAMFDHADDVLNVETENASDLNDLQILVSNGVTNFIKSILVERDQMPRIVYKIKEPIRLEDYNSSPTGQISLTMVKMNGFPALRPSNPIKLEVSSSDAEQLKRYRVSYKTDETKGEMIVSGDYRAYTNAGSFSCRFSNVNYESTRQMLRRYDFLNWPTNIKEVLEFEKMDCHVEPRSASASGASTAKADVIEAVLTALSGSWLDSVVNVANAVSLEPAIRNTSHTFTEVYRERVLSKVISSSLNYLRNINVDSFDVTPSLKTANATTTSSSRDNGGGGGGVQLTLPYQYNVKIVNLFNYTRDKIAYDIDESSTNVMKILGRYVVYYDATAPAIFRISAKDDPEDLMEVVIDSIEFDVQFAVESINQVRQFNVAHVNTKVVESKTPASKSNNILYLMFRKYLGFELSNELWRSLTYLTSKVDFYRLNVL